jgi:hypothetical protein
LVCSVRRHKQLVFWLDNQRTTSCRRAARDDASTSLAAKLRAMDGLRGFD